MHERNSGRGEEEASVQQATHQRGDTRPRRDHRTLTHEKPLAKGLLSGIAHVECACTHLRLRVAVVLVCPPRERRGFSLPARPSLGCVCVCAYPVRCTVRRRAAGFVSFYKNPNAIIIINTFTVPLASDRSFYYELYTYYRTPACRVGPGRRWHRPPPKCPLSRVSADRPRHVDFFVKNWARGGVYV